MTNFAKRYEKLNPAQKEAVNTLDGPVLVVAGPGSGKTELLGLRIGNILNQTDVSPANILCLTFTDSAAVNMRLRLQDLIGLEANQVGVYTFHSFAGQVINLYPEKYNFGLNSKPASTIQQTIILRDILEYLSQADPLRTIAQDGKFYYLYGTGQAISQLKRAGLTPDEFKQLLIQNQTELPTLNQALNQIFSKTVSQKTLSEVQVFIQDNSRELGTESQAGFSSLKNSVISSLSLTVLEAIKLGKNAPLSSWKSDHLETNQAGDKQLKETSQLSKLFSLASIYQQYQAELRRQVLYDYDDMLLETTQLLEHNPEILADLQEKYQYILVDEFQDTNDVQMRLLFLLTNAEVLEGRPNLMAVGDDDQAIYKFQGAQIRNIFRFKETFDTPKIIELLENYRSEPEILDLAANVIGQGLERLAVLMPEITKSIRTSKKPSSSNQSVVQAISYPNFTEQAAGIVQMVEKELQEGKAPNQIAVIAREHKQLERLLPHFYKAGIPVQYERMLDLLKEPFLLQLIQICRFILSGLNRRISTMEDLLPEILSYPFWGLPRGEVIAVARLVKAQGYKNKPQDPWLVAMDQLPSTQKIANFLMSLIENARALPLDTILHQIIGTNRLPEEAENADFDQFEPENSTQAFVSPFKSYYFDPYLKTNPDRYLYFLASLQALMDELKNYRSSKLLQVQDLVELVDQITDSRISLPTKSAHLGELKAVQLLTAHKSKGMEFEVVIIPDALDEYWAKQKSRTGISLPLNLPIAPEQDSSDDQLRLLYVSITRAKQKLFLTRYKLEDNGAETNPLRYLQGLEWRDLVISKPDQIKALENAWGSYYHPPFNQKETGIIQDLLRNYKLSSTHLNSFLDLRYGGPQLFFENYILRFPQPQSIPLSFGNAIHRTLNFAQNKYKEEDERPNLSALLEHFEIELQKERLSLSDQRVQSERGEAVLSNYYTWMEPLDKADVAEIGFWGENVEVKGVPLTGKIDLLHKISPQNYSVTDYKTGKAPQKGWEEKGEAEQLKLINYQRQLYFYKLMLENSASYKGSFVQKGKIVFVEGQDAKTGILTLDLDKVDLERYLALLVAVHRHILEQNFPDVSGYESGKLAEQTRYEDDLITGKI